MRGPSVYLVGLMWRWGSSFIVGLGSLFLLLWLASLLPPVAPHGWPMAGALAVWVVLNGWLFLTFPGCPRCGLNVFLEVRERWLPVPGQYLFSRLRRRVWRPSDSCARCGLDLHAYSLFDPKARREG